jgi:uncharacterized RDD family membrane protein YckC
MGASDLDRIVIEFPGVTAAEAAVIAQECARRLQEEAGVQSGAITVARTEQDALDLGGALAILGGLGFTFLEGFAKGAIEQAGKDAWRVTIKAATKLPGTIERVLEAVSKRHRTPVRVQGLGDRMWTLGTEFTRTPPAGTTDGAASFGTLGIVILGASEFPYMNDASLNNPALARSAQLAETLFSPPNTAFARTAILNLFDSDKSPVEVLDAIERHIDAHSDMRDLLIYYCGHGSFHEDNTYFLLLRTTRKDFAMTTGFAPRALCKDLLEKRHGNKRVYFVVDACFSGAVVNSMLTTTLDRVVQEHLTLDMPQRGWSVLTASSKDNVALAPEGTAYTMFTGALAHVIEGGIGGGVRFNLYDLCNEARLYVRDKWKRQAVEPQCFSPKQDGGDVGLLPIFRNRHAGAACVAEIDDPAPRKAAPVRKADSAAARPHLAMEERGAEAARDKLWLDAQRTLKVLLRYLNVRVSLFLAVLGLIAALVTPGLAILIMLAAYIALGWSTWTQHLNIQMPAGTSSVPPPPPSTRPAHPLDGMWYLEGDAGVLGPYKGYAVRNMVQSGRFGSATTIAAAGSTSWTALGDSPVFARYLQGREQASVTGVAVRYAGFWIRLVAGLIDVAMLYFLAVAVVSIFDGRLLGRFGDISGRTIDSLFWLVRGDFDVGLENLGESLRYLGNYEPVAGLGVLGVVLLYLVFFPSVLQGTLGKRVCGLRLTREDGGWISPLLALKRFLSYFISALPAGLGFLMIGVDGQKRGFHDLICGTRVVWRRPHGASSR